MTEIYLGLGSNLGNRKQNINRAIIRLRNHLTIQKVSSFYETEPVGFLGQGWFVNCVIEGSTEISPDALLEAIHAVEKRMGKKVVRKNGPRRIDIDILLYGNKRVKNPHMTIPHPRFHTRAFVIVPFAEIAPKKTHPVLKKSISELLKELKTAKKVRRVP